MRADNPEAILLKDAKRRAKREDLPFNLTLADICIPITCPALGIVLKTGSGKIIDTSPTLDRTVPELGYTSGNVNVISNLANRIKTNAKPQQIAAVAEWCFRTIKPLH